MGRIGPPRLTTTWKYALVGGLLALPFTALELRQSPENATLGMFVVGSLLAGYLVKRHDGNSTATGLRAALVGGFPALWALTGLLGAIPTIPNPTWFRAVGIVMALALGVMTLAVLAFCGALAGRLGGWLAERRGHGGTVDARGSV